MLYILLFMLPSNCKIKILQTSDIQATVLGSDSNTSGDMLCGHYKEWGCDFLKG